MLELIKNIFKFLQIIILFFISLIIFYWMLVQANLPSFKGIQIILGIIFDPIIAFFGSIYQYSMVYEGKTVNMSAFVAVLVLLVILFICHILIKVIEFLQQKIKKIKEFKKTIDEEKIQKEVTSNYMKKLAEQKICYLMVEIYKTTSSIAYLLEDFDESELMQPISEVIDYASHYHGKFIRKKEDNNIQNYLFAFYNQEEAVDYAFYIERNMKNVRNKLDQSGIIMGYKIVVDCAINEFQIDIITKILEKMVNIAGANQFICTSLFSEKYKNTGKNSNIKFIQKGLYNILNKKYELFDVKKGL